MIYYRFPIIVVLFVFFIFSGNSCAIKIHTEERLLYSLNWQNKKELNLLLKKLTTEKNSENLLQIIKRLGEIGDKRASTALKHFYRKGDKKVKQEIKKSVTLIYNKGKFHYGVHYLSKTKDPMKRIDILYDINKYVDKSDKKTYKLMGELIEKNCMADSVNSLSIQAIQCLGDFKVEASIGIIIDVLFSDAKDHRYRAAAQNALIAIGEPALPHLIDAYFSRDNKEWEGKRKYIKKVISFTKEPAILYLEKRFYSADDSLKIRIIELLSTMQEDSAYAVLINFFDHSDLNPAITCRLIQAAGNTKRREFVPYLIHFVKSDDFTIYKDCLAIAFAGSGRNAVAPLKSMLQEVSDRRGKIFLIGLMGKLKAADSIDMLRDNFSLEDMEISRTVVRSLIQINNIRAKDVFLKIIREDISELTDMAITGLSYLGAAIIPDLEQLLKRRKDSTVALNVLKVLGRKKNPAFYDLMIAIFLTYRDKRIALQAIQYFAQYHVKKAERHVIPYMNYNDTEIRWAAAEALGTFKSGKVINKIIQMMTESDGGVSHRTGIHSRAVNILIKIGPKAIPSLLLALENDNNRIREYSAWILGKICNEQCIEPIKKMLLKGGDPEIFVYVMQDNSLSLTKVPAAYEALRLLESSFLNSK